MAFAGESVGIDWANPITGTFPASWYGSDIHFRRDALSVSLTAGMSFIAGYYNYQELPSATEPVEASVVLVCGPSTSGTVSISVGMDPDWNLDNPALATLDLGSHSVAGATDLVVPISSFDVAAFYNYDGEYIVYVETDSGTVDLMQMKLRIWPPDGPQGDWAIGPAATRETSASMTAAKVPGLGSVYGEGNGDAAFGVAVTDYEGNAAAAPSGSSLYTVDGETHFGVNVWARVADGISPATLDPFTECFVYGANIWVRSNLDGQVITSVSGVSSGTHPDEVPGEPGSSFVLPSGESATWEHLSWTRDIRVVGDNMSSTAPYCGLLDFIGGEVAPPISGGNFVTPHVPDVPNSGAVGNGLVNVATPSSAAFKIRMGSWTWGSRSPMDSEAQFRVEIPIAIRSVVGTPEGYLYWDPSLPWAEAVDDSDVIPGYLINPNPDLDGLGLGVNVDFSG